MNRENANDYLPLVQALSEGKVIQYKYQKSDKSYDWMSLGEVGFSMPVDFYRIKPEPREIWVNHSSDHKQETGYAYPTKESAAFVCRPWQETVRYREVLE